jgi:hypothetical protein
MNPDQSNPEYSDQESPAAKRVIATAAVLDDVAIALILAGGTMAASLGRNFGNMVGRFGRKGLIAAAIAGTMTLGTFGNVPAGEIASSKYGLNPAVQYKLEQLQTVAAKEGISFKVTQGYRSQAEQDILYAKGRTIPGKQVTWKKISEHTSKNAFDIAITQGKAVSWDPKDYKRIGELGKSVGLTWGGDWEKRDLVHFQLSAASPVTSKIAERSAQVRRTTDYVAALGNKDPSYQKNVSDLLYETAAQESMRFRYDKQVGGQGKAVSIFQIEPKTAENLVKWSATRPEALNLLTTTSGLTAKQLSALTRDQLVDSLAKNEKFAAAMARVKYLSVPGKIPSTLEARAAYWSKWYQGTNNPVKQDQYLRNSRLIAEEVKASALSNVIKKHIEVKPTQGLVNKVLHEGKIMHNVASKTKKSSRMWKILGRR